MGNTVQISDILSNFDTNNFENKSMIETNIENKQTIDESHDDNKVKDKISEDKKSSSDNDKIRTQKKVS